MGHRDSLLVTRQSRWGRHAKRLPLRPRSSRLCYDSHNLGGRMTLIPYRCLARILPPIHLVALACWAQTNVGRISGSVQDTTGASIPHCAVIVTNPATGFRQTSSTDSAGLFVFPSLLAGTYKLRVEHQ